MSRHIDAEWLIKESMPLSFSVQKWVNEVQIMTAPSIDIVRCKECKWWIDNLTENDDDEAYDSCRWDWSRKIPTADDFCSYGERKEGK